MTNNSLVCMIEFVGLILIAVLVAGLQFWAKNRETIRSNRPQLVLMLAGILGANLGYILLAGGYFLSIRMDDPALTESFLAPASWMVYLMCAIPLYLPLGVICGLLVDRYARRREMEARAAFFLTLLTALVIGAVLAVPIYLLGIIAAAV